MSKKKYHVTGAVTGSHYAGIFEAETPEEALELANRETHLSMCHQCSSDCEDPEFNAVDAEEVNPNDPDT